MVGVGISTYEQRFLVGRFSLYKVCLVKCWRRHFACARRLFVGILRMLVDIFFLRRRCCRKCFVVILEVVFCCCDMRRGVSHPCILICIWFVFSENVTC